LSACARLIELVTQLGNGGGELWLSRQNSAPVPGRSLI
jgi:hypothetical protein